MTRSQDYVGIGLAAAAFSAIDLGTRIFATNDEARFPMLAHDVLARGDWLFPQLNGAPYYNKPVLLAWLIALVSWPAGHVTQLTAAIPSALAAVLAVVSIYGIGRDLFGRDAGRFAALIALTTQGLYVHARLPMPDMLMTAFMAASLGILWAMIRGSHPSAWLGFYTLVGAAFWAKGPAGLLPLVVVFVYAIRARRTPHAASLRLWRGLVLVAVFVGGWWMLGKIGDERAVRQAVVVDQLMWYTPHAPTIGLVTAPIREVFGIVFPWVLLLPIALVHAGRVLRQRGPERDGVVFLLLWAAVVFVMVAASHQQRTRYYLPMLPPLALLTGWWVARSAIEDRSRQRVPWRMYGITGAIFVVAALAIHATKSRWLPEDAQRSLPSSPVGLIVLAVALGLTVAAFIHGMLDAMPRRTFAVACIGSAIFVVGAYHSEITQRNAAYDYRRMHGEMNPLVPDSRVVAAWGVPELPLSFYFDRRVVAVDTDQALRQAVDADPRSLAILSEGALQQLVERDRAQVLMRTRVGFRPVALVRYDAR